MADPAIIYIGTWTGSSGKLKRIGRIINLAKGIIYNTIYKEGYNGEPTDLTKAQNQPETVEAIGKLRRFREVLYLRIRLAFRSANLVDITSCHWKENCFMGLPGFCKRPASTSLVLQDELLAYQRLGG